MKFALSLEMKIDVRIQSNTPFTIMQIRAEGNKHLAKRLIAGNLKNLSSSVEILEAHLSPYTSASGGDTKMENKKCFVYYMKTVERLHKTPTIKPK